MSQIGIDTRLIYYRHGGIAEYMRQLIHGLGKLEPTHTYHILHNFRAKEPLIPTQNFIRGNYFTPCHHRFENWALGLELLPRRLDLLHSPDFIPPLFGARKWVITVHDLAFLHFPDIQTADSLRYYAGNIQRAVNQAHRIIAVSEATRADIINLLGVATEKITVIPEGVHPQFHPLPHAELKQTLARYDLVTDDYLLFVGTLEPRKNLNITLQAYQIAKAQHPDLPRLVIAGQKGWLADDIVKAIAATQDVIWIDSPPFAALPILYNGARLHLLLSRYEGFGFPPLEAMACGTPTLVSNRGALQEVVGNAGLFADPDDPEAIATALIRLASDEALRQDLIKQGITRAARFNWEDTARQTLKVYNEVLAQ